MQNANNGQIKWHAKKRNLAVFLAGIMLIAYVSFLLVTNYLSAANLQRTLLEQLKRDTEWHATAVAYFFSERKDDLVNLALSREVSVFFENKALGMSMEYGLRQSLIPISDRFQDLIRRKKIGEDAIYSRIVLIEKGGSLLVDAAASRSLIKMRDEWSKHLPQDHEEAVVASSIDGRELRISISYFHKEKYAGRIIAWVEPETLYKHLLMEEGTANRMTFLVTDEKSGSLPVFMQPPPFASGFPDFGKIEIGRPLEFEANNYQGSNRKLIALRLPVQGTPFSLVVFASDPEIIGRPNPWQLVTRMALLALFSSFRHNSMRQCCGKPSFRRSARSWKRKLRNAEEWRLPCRIRKKIVGDHRLPAGRDFCNRSNRKSHCLEQGHRGHDGNKGGRHAGQGQQ